MFVGDAQLAGGVAVEDVGGADDFESFLGALAADFAGSGLKLKGVASNASVGSAEDHVDGADLDVHSCFKIEVLARAAHGTEPAGLAAAHGHLKHRAAGGVEGIQLFLGLGQKNRPEFLNGSANIFGSETFCGDGHELLPREVRALVLV